MADILAYLQHYLYGVTERQNNLETNINNALSTLTVQLQQLMQLVSNSPSQPLALVANSLLPTVLASPSLANLYSQVYPKLSFSPDFSGDCNTRQAFLNFCMLYIHLALEQFSCKEKKALQALIFFKSSCMAKQSKNLFCQETDTGFFPIQTQTNFEAQFKAQFFLVNTEVDAVNTLEGFSYHQGTWTVNNYLDTFQLLISNTDYTDLQTLMVKFCQGLRIGIQNQIVIMLYRYPSDIDLED